MVIFIELIITFFHEAFFLFLKSSDKIRNQGFRFFFQRYLIFFVYIYWQAHYCFVAIIYDNRVCLQNSRVQINVAYRINKIHILNHHSQILFFFTIWVIQKMVEIYSICSLASSSSINNVL